MPHNFVRMSTSEEKRICEGVSDKLLDSRVSDIHIAEIATDLVDWELLAPGVTVWDVHPLTCPPGQYSLGNIVPPDIIH